MRSRGARLDGCRGMRFSQPRAPCKRGFGSASGVEPECNARNARVSRRERHGTPLAGRCAARDTREAPTFRAVARRRLRRGGSQSLPAAFMTFPAACMSLPTLAERVGALACGQATGARAPCALSPTLPTVAGPSDPSSRPLRLAMPRSTRSPRRVTTARATSDHCAYQA